MIDRRLGPVKVLKGKQTEIDFSILEEGYFVYSTDKKRLYIADGLTKGSVSVSNKTFITYDEVIPVGTLYGDIVYDANSEKTYITGYDTNGKTLKLLLISDNSYYEKLKIQVDKLYETYLILAACIEDPNKVDNICPCG